MSIEQKPHGAYSSKSSSVASKSSDIFTNPFALPNLGTVPSKRIGTILKDAPSLRIITTSSPPATPSMNSANALQLLSIQPDAWVLSHKSLNRFGCRYHSPIAHPLFFLQFKQKSEHYTHLANSIADFPKSDRI
jgi:hypothetical protein